MSLSGILWPAHLKPLPDELLSSWLVRLARAHSLKLHTFCDITWPGKAMWNRDIDKSVDNDVLNILAKKTGTSIERVLQTALANFEGTVYEKHNPYGNTRLILPLGIYHRLHKKHGLQFCAECLKNDEEPYFRRVWRLAFITTCTIHKKTLLDRCPICEEPLNFHRNQYQANSITLCHICGEDMRDCVSYQSTSYTREIIFHKKLIKGIEDGWFVISDTEEMYSILFFSVLRQLMKLLLHKRNDKALEKLIPDSMWAIMPCMPQNGKIADVEKHDVTCRRALLLITGWLLDDWPGRFIATCNSAKIWSSILLKDMSDIPYWYYRTVTDNLYFPDYVTTEQEIDSVLKYLNKVNIPATEKLVSQMIGVTQVYRKRYKLY